MFTPGKRVYPNEKGDLFLGEGDYGKDKRGMWLARAPGTHTGDLSRHTVVEHEDGTITVSPSILIKSYDCEWHGYLEKGMWRSV